MPPLHFRLPGHRRPVPPSAASRTTSTRDLRTVRRIGAGALTASALILGPASAAQAHVYVHPDSTVAGSDSVLTFRVPSESETAGTTKLTITLPQDHPFLKLAARSMPGWTVTVTDDPLPTPVEVAGTTLTSAPHTVTWTAKSGAQIPPEQYENFDLSVSPLPGSGEVMFTAKQSYSDGSVVAWNEPSPAGGDEPEHPAPGFTVTKAVADTTAVTEPDAASTSGSGDTLTRLLAGAGLLAGLAALGLIVARRSPRRLPIAVNHPST